MDFVYPVSDMGQATSFYTPILGEPEYETGSQTAYNLNGQRFILDSSDQNGFVQSPLLQGETNGYRRHRRCETP